MYNMNYGKDNEAIIQKSFFLRSMQKPPTIPAITKQIMPEVVILGLINDYLAYRDLMRAEGPKHIPIF